jgi:fructosamine-3-kinase
VKRPGIISAAGQLLNTCAGADFGGDGVTFEAIEKAISGSTGRPFAVERHTTLGGGCINEALRLEGCGQAYLVKLNRAERLDMFEAEALGLATIAATGAIRVPQPVASGLHGARAFLALEYIEFGRSGGAGAHLGQQLAALHRHSADAFGWERDNTIGATPQPNAWSGDWVDFLRERRLGHQLQLAAHNGAGKTLLDSGARLLDSLPGFFTGYAPAPSLLHGDLWGGNWGVDVSGEPVLFDPAVYYGDREADLAMTELFGGFDDRFYHSYRDRWDIDPGYATRKVLYNLYHVLNHFNLFGGGYAAQAEGMISRLLAEV